MLYVASICVSGRQLKRNFVPAPMKHSDIDPVCFLWLLCCMYQYVNVPLTIMNDCVSVSVCVGIDLALTELFHHSSLHLTFMRQSSGSFLLPQRWHLEAGITAPRFRPHPHTGSEVRGRGGDDGPLSVFKEWIHSKLNQSIFESRINSALLDLGPLTFQSEAETLFKWSKCGDLNC